MNIPELPGTERYTREDVVEAFRKLASEAILDPVFLDKSKPEVAEAEHMLTLWSADAEQQARTSGDPADLIRYDLSRTTVHVDAGFHDKDYLDEVANDWLGGNTLADAEAAGLTDVTTEIEAKIASIEKIIAATKEA